MSVQVLPVRTRRERRSLLTFPWQIYRHDPLWVPPLLPERAKEIDPRRGVFFERGEAAFFIAWQDGRPVGTICAAEDRAANAVRGVRECVFGFFECIADYAVAEALFQCAMEWARERDLDTLFGPFNLDYENGYGLLIEGRDRPPVMLCGHTPPYYQTFVERFGFQPARGDNLAYAVDLDRDTLALQRLARLAQRVRERKEFVVRGADLEHYEEEADRVLRLLNVALAHLPDNIPWRREVLLETFDQFRRIADPELILFAEADGETVGWFPGVADINEALQHANGLRFPWNYAQLWWYAHQKPACLAVKSVLVLPEYWGTGVSVLLFDEMARLARAKGFRWIDLSLTSADNPFTPTLAERLGAKLYKRYRVYRLPFAV
jgi:GNAT superfamily N-acetyltransferase